MVGLAAQPLHMLTLKSASFTKPNIYPLNPQHPTTASRAGAHPAQGPPHWGAAAANSRVLYYEISNTECPLPQGRSSRRDLLFGALIALSSFTGYRWATGRGSDQEEQQGAFDGGAAPGSRSMKRVLYPEDGGVFVSRTDGSLMRVCPALRGFRVQCPTVSKHQEIGSKP